MRRLVDRVALVTGAGHGIGRAVAERLAAEGAAVAVADLDTDAAAEVAGAVQRAGGAALAVPCDVTDAAAVRSAVRAAVDRYGRLDILVNNVGVSFGTRLEDMDDPSWYGQLDPTLYGAVRCVKAALPHLLAAPAGGSVVSISSVNGLAAFGDLAYSAAKAGLANLTANLAVQYGRRARQRAGSDSRGVRFNVVAPGTIRTRVWEGSPQRRAALARMARLYPTGRVGEPADIAAAVAFLASDDAAWITGIVLPVDGGALAGPLHTLLEFGEGDDAEVDSLPL